jgi:hypothetical protein
VLEIGSRTLGMEDKCPTTELYPQPLFKVVSIVPLQIFIQYFYWLLFYFSAIFGSIIFYFLFGFLRLIYIHICVIYI